MVPTRRTVRRVARGRTPATGSARPVARRSPPTTGRPERRPTGRPLGPAAATAPQTTGVPGHPTPSARSSRVTTTGGRTPRTPTSRVWNPGRSAVRSVVPCSSRRRSGAPIVAHTSRTSPAAVTTRASRRNRRAHTVQPTLARTGRSRPRGDTTPARATMTSGRDATDGTSRATAASVGAAHGSAATERPRPVTAKSSTNGSDGVNRSAPGASRHGRPPDAIPSSPDEDRPGVSHLVGRRRTGTGASGWPSGRPPGGPTRTRRTHRPSRAAAGGSACSSPQC